MKKAEITALEKVFAAEIENRCGIPLFPSKARVFRDLAEKGMVTEETVTLGGLFPVSITGYALTHRGRIAYCETCRDVE